MVGSAVATIFWSTAARSMPSMIPEKTISTCRFGRAAGVGGVDSIRALGKVAENATLR
jgi:hypothetical protein